LGPADEGAEATGVRSCNALKSEEHDLIPAAVQIE